MTVSTSEIDRETLSVVQLGLYDSAIPCRDFWLYQIGRVVIALVGEHTESPKVFFHRQFDDEADAREFLVYLLSSESVESDTDLEDQSIDDQLEEMWLLS